MKVLFDHQIFTMQKFGGVSRYFYELMTEFRKMRGIEFNLPIKYSNNHYLLNASLDLNVEKFLTMDELFIASNFIGNAKLYRFLKFLNIVKDAEKYNRKKSITAINARLYDIFHPTYYNPYFTRYIGKKPFVITVYDMIHEIFGNRFVGYNDDTIDWKKELVHKASRIIAISKNTKKDIIKLYGLNEDKIEVIYLGSPYRQDFNNSFSFPIPANYILFVGDRFAYKNFYNFICAASKIINNNDIYVICAGSQKFSKQESELLSKLRIDHKVLHVSANDDKTFPFLYKHALCFVFPSLYEGFGIPVLEAFTYGCPVVLSNTSSFPEVAGDAGIYFDPENIESITESLAQVIYDNDLRKGLAQLGFHQLSKFSFEFTARKTIEVYRSVLK